LYNEFCVASSTQLESVLSAIQDIPLMMPYTITFIADFTIMPQDLTLAAYQNKPIIMRGNSTSRVIGLSSQGSMFTIGANVELVLEDITLEGLSDNTASLVYVNGGSFTMQGEASVIGNRISWRNGGGVYINNGTFIMQGNALVSGNITYGAGTYGGGVYVIGGEFTMQDSASVSDNTGHNGGGGVCVQVGGSFVMKGNSSVSGNVGEYGGGVNVNGEFTMQDNTSVSENVDLSNGNGSGGGVYVTGKFNMKDNALVSDNTVGWGGGVCVNMNGLFIMEGSASVSNNTASVSIPADYGDGGGVLVRGGTFTMKSGTVSGNYANNGGGGVCVGWNGSFNGSFTMEGGTVSSNTANGNGGGVYVVSETLSGGEYIKGIFHIVNGIVYGSNASPVGLANNAPNGVALYRDDDTAIAEYGDGSFWTGISNLDTRDNTIEVIDGALQ